MYLRNKGIIYIISVLLFYITLVFIDKRIEKDFNELLKTAIKTVEKNLSSEERGSLGLNPKLTYISLSLKLEYVPYIDYKLRYCHKYILLDKYPEKTFRYYL